MCIPRRMLTLITTAFLLVSNGVCSASDLSAPDALPPTVVAYAEIADPPALLATLLKHAQREPFQRLIKDISPQQRADLLKFQLGARFVEAAIGQPWRHTIESLTQHGLHIALDAETEGVVLLAHADDPDLLIRTRDVLLSMATNHAEDDEQSGDVEDVEYRGVAAHKVGDLGAAIVDDWLVVTNNSELGKQVLDRLLGDDLPSLGGRDAFQSSTATGDASSAWAWVDLATLREAGVAEELFRGRAEDFGGELILGGVFAALGDSQYATAAIDLGASGLHITATLPRDETTDHIQREYFFGPDNLGAVPPTIFVDRNLGVIRAHRDIAALWRQSPDLFDQQVNAGLAKAESDLSNLFGGKSFSDEILGALGPQIQLVLARQTYPDGEAPTPAIRLPAGAFVFQLIDPQESQRPLKIAFQTLIGFVNIGAAQQGRAPLELSTERLDGVTMASTAYDPGDAEDFEAAHIQFNFSPTVAFVNQWLVLSSTRGLALDVVAKLTHRDSEQSLPDESHDGGAINTSVDVAMPELAALLAENRENLIAQNMLEEGHSREDAEQHIAMVEMIAEALQRAHLDLATVDGKLQLRFGVDLAE